LEFYLFIYFQLCSSDGRLIGDIGESEAETMKTRKSRRREKERERRTVLGGNKIDGSLSMVLKTGPAGSTGSTGDPCLIRFGFVKKPKN
jgi:hypothetical protein